MGRQVRPEEKKPGAIGDPGRAACKERRFSTAGVIAFHHAPSIDPQTPEPEGG
jgi:hypothetical protein